MRAICVLIASLAIAAPALAAPPRSEKVRAELLRKSAERSMRTGDYAQAIALLEEAYKQAPEARDLLDIATAYDEWGDHCPAAIEAFKRFFEACGSCAALETGKSEYLLVQNRCASDVTILTTPPGAVVRIQSDDWGRMTPFTTRLRPGHYLLEVHRFAHLPTTTEIEVAPSSPQTFALNLDRAPGVTDDDLTIVDPSTVRRAPAPPAKATPEDAGPSGWAIAGFGTGLAGAIAGTIFTYAALNDVDEVLHLEHAPARDMEAIDDRRSSATRNAVLSYVAFGVSLIGFAGSIAAHYADSP